jgi:hypothetical protein
MNEQKKRRVVLAITPERKDQNGNVVRKEGSGSWSEVGVAWTNNDESINIILDAIPVSGRLQIRDQRPRKDMEPQLPTTGGAA